MDRDPASGTAMVPAEDDGTPGEWVLAHADLTPEERAVADALLHMHGRPVVDPVEDTEAAAWAVADDTPIHWGRPE
jgi:hypothetical protein